MLNMRKAESFASSIEGITETKSEYTNSEASITPESFGATGDGTRDDTEIMRLTFNASSKTKDRSVRLSRRYRTKGVVEVPSGCQLIGGGSVDVVDGTWLIGSGCSLSGLTFTDLNRKGWAPVLKVGYGSERVNISECHVEGGTAIWLNVNRQVVLSKNTFISNGGYPIFSDGLQNSVISENSVQTFGGYGIQLSGNLLDNHVTKNVVMADGTTRTGIIILSQKFGRMSGNWICGNIISNVSEEGISIDINTPLMSANLSRNLDIGQQAAFCWLEKNIATEDLVDRTFVILDGANAGSFSVIENAQLGEDTSLGLSTAFSARLAAGTLVGIGWAPHDNRICDNMIDRAGRNGIMLGADIDRR